MNDDRYPAPERRRSGLGIFAAALVSFLLALLLLAVPARAETADWTPGGIASPTYSMPLRVVDSVAGTFRPTRRAEWNAQLRKALDAWGLPYEVVRRSEASLPFLATDENISTLGVNPLIVPNAVALIRGRFESDAGDSAGWAESAGGGIALLSPWKGWWSGPGAISAVVAHEFGHAIGFQHGGTGSMYGAQKPNAEERALAAAYYGI